MIIGFFLVKTGGIDKIRNIETIAWTTIIFGILLYISDKFKMRKKYQRKFFFKISNFYRFISNFIIISWCKQIWNCYNSCKIFKF